MTSGPELHPAASAVLGDPAEAVLEITRHAAFWITGYALWTGVVAALLAAGYPRERVIAVVVLQLATWVPVPVAIAVGRRRGEDTHRLTGTLLWVAVLDGVLTVAVTGGLRSPVALTLFVHFSALFSRYGLSRTGKLAFAVCCTSMLALAVAPASWFGPPLADGWFQVVAVLGAVSTLGIHIRYVTALRQSANAALGDALRTREDLAEHALARAHELEALGARLSHELKNPLGAMKPLVQILRRNAADARTRDRLAVVEGEVDRMAHVVNDHLTFARPLGRAQLAPVDVGELAQSVVAALQGRAEAAGVRLRCSGGATALADARRVKEALFNLVANAIEACAPDAHVEVRVEPDATGARISVADTGRGMTPEVLARLGTPFFTTREEGTGLGVVLARVVFEQHGGALRYSSAPGQGTTALATLPAAAAARGR
jgi:signal transduction histidine kinase